MFPNRVAQIGNDQFLCRLLLFVEGIRSMAEHLNDAMESGKHVTPLMFEKIDTEQADKCYKAILYYFKGCTI